MTVISDLLENVNDILEVRDQIGAALKPVAIVTRSWSGSELGDGSPSETRQQVTPSPRVVEFSADSKVLQGGTVKQGDIILKMISKQTFPTENMIDCSVNSPSVEKFYEVGGIQYQVIRVQEKHLTWTVHLRRRSRQE